jgi:hypothetical protein
VFGIVKFRDDIFYQPTPMEELIAELQYAPDEVVNEWASDVDYYMEDVSSL